jgi:hypothetical protein
MGSGTGVISRRSYRFAGIHRTNHTICSMWNPAAGRGHEGGQPGSVHHQAPEGPNRAMSGGAASSPKMTAYPWSELNLLGFWPATAEFTHSAAIQYCVDIDSPRVGGTRIRHARGEDGNGVLGSQLEGSGALASRFRAVFSASQGPRPREAILQSGSAEGLTAFDPISSQDCNVGHGWERQVLSPPQARRVYADGDRPGAYPCIHGPVPLDEQISDDSRPGCPSIAQQ